MSDKLTGRDITELKTITGVETSEGEREVNYLLGKGYKIWTVPRLIAYENNTNTLAVCMGKFKEN